jgi:hypothetical protein
MVPTSNNRCFMEPGAATGLPAGKICHSNGAGQPPCGVPGRLPATACTNGEQIYPLVLKKLIRRTARAGSSKGAPVCAANRIVSIWKHQNLLDIQ